MANSVNPSITVSSVLESMGFSQEMIDFRINNAKHMDVIGAFTDLNMVRIVTGGKAEGTSRWEDGDIDTMFVHKFTIVTGQHVDPPSPLHTVFHTEDHRAHSGYTWLRLARCGEMDDDIRNSLVTENLQGTYLSSFKYIQIERHSIQHLSPSQVQHQPISGPALPLISNDIHRDIVHAYPHIGWPTQASKWAERCRRRGWPHESVVTAIIRSGCHVVPKGFKESPNEHMEWCLSFAIHEKSIIQIFNLAQTHLYILLKLIAKDMKTTFPNIMTSYTMKTVVLWHMECHHTGDWNRSHLLERLMEALHFLKYCVKNQYLPAYFIPENNLFDGKIDNVTAARLSDKLDDLLSQGAGCVFRIKQIRDELQAFDKYWRGMETCILISQCCKGLLRIYLSERNICRILSQTQSPVLTRDRSLTRDVSKTMKATLSYIKIAKVRKALISADRKYELFGSLLHIASVNSDTDRMAGKIKFAGVLHVLGKTKQAMEILYSIQLRPLFGVSIKSHPRYIISEKYIFDKATSDHIDHVVARLGRDVYVQHCDSLDVRYTIDEIDIAPDVIKYELFQIPETLSSIYGAYIDPDILRLYLLYKCHSELGDDEYAQIAFIYLINVATQERFDPYMEYREVALNVLGLCYMKKKDYRLAYFCFCRAMSLRPRLLKEKWSSSSPWHLAVLASKLITRAQDGCSQHQSIQSVPNSRTQPIEKSKNATITRTFASSTAVEIPHQQS